MELSPRTAPDAAGPATPRRRRSPVAYGVLVLVLVAIGVVAYQALSSASLYFYNADEAVEQRTDLVGDRIRVQGVVMDDVAPQPGDRGITFTIKFNGAELPVEHEGDPPELFEPGVPVVLEGQFLASPDAFMSDRILVRHTPEYEAENQDRIDDAEDGESGEPATP
ncbi:MAG: cytochrome c maturation protein CcmE [Acidimicrobiales bacterium]